MATRHIPLWVDGEKFHAVEFDDATGRTSGGETLEEVLALVQEARAHYRSKARTDAQLESLVGLLGADAAITFLEGLR